jgi:hypothetical protein
VPSLLHNTNSSSSISSSLAPAPSPSRHRKLVPRATPTPTTAKPTTAKPTTAMPTAAQPMPTAAPVLVPTPAPTPLRCPDTRGSNSAAVLYDADKWTGSAWRYVCMLPYDILVLSFGLVAIVCTHDCAAAAAVSAHTVIDHCVICSSRLLVRMISATCTSCADLLTDAASSTSHCSCKLLSTGNSYACWGVTGALCQCPNLASSCLGKGAYGDNKISSMSSSGATTTFVYRDKSYVYYLGYIGLGVRMNFGGTIANNAITSLQIRVGF